MKAMMSETLRGILSDPKKNRALEEGISRLSSQRENAKASTIISVGGHEYKVRFVKADSKKRSK